jgi:hypothetical protein
MGLAVGPIGNRLHLEAVVALDVVETPGAVIAHFSAFSEN